MRAGMADRGSSRDEEEGRQRSRETADDGPDASGVTGSTIASLIRRSPAGSPGSGCGCGRGGGINPPGLGDLLGRVASQNPEEIQPLIVGCKPHAQPLIGAKLHLPDQKTGGKNAAIARGDHAVAGADLLGRFQEFDQAGHAVLSPTSIAFWPEGCIVTGMRLEASVSRITRAVVLADARYPPHEPEPVHRRPAIDDAVARADIQQDRLPEGRAAASASTTPETEVSFGSSRTLFCASSLAFCCSS